MEESQTHVFEPIELSRKQVDDSIFSRWYPSYKGDTIESRVISPLPQAFIDALNGESIHMPHEMGNPVEANSDNDYSDWSEDEAQDGRSEDSDDEEDENNRRRLDPAKDFPELHDQIKRHIEELGGAVMPKLNWSAPKDARWIMADNTLRCTSPADVYLLLQASDHIAHDIDAPYGECTDGAAEQSGGKSDAAAPLELVLRRWTNINPALEFRVFVRSGGVVAAAQRDRNHFPFLAGLKPTLARLIWNFVDSTLVPRLTHPDAVVDIYVPQPYRRVVLVDINPWSRTADPLLFAWNEILHLAPERSPQFAFRLVDRPNNAAFAAKEYSESMLPLDVVHAAADPAALVDLARASRASQDRLESRSDGPTI
ncbi:Piso0_000399 [Millerozyma farinosa CBS 7064]|uniref:Piso0_000399 protein n=1 Tax=Pichia sorbitophila (strain ATCC MYA-4447 / BCRC 22081 / CBS 7064 / NBRC 10061 / NRRL Y-12695) TaxID=559304 RepID=G8YVC2_PICSO|nr:Piso0_000399 [Millerozyma farinosa CBS 7064]CCE73366.1 Piso0_000399 [Millerozyma farinosa CBS 7064]